MAYLAQYNLKLTNFFGELETLLYSHSIILYSINISYHFPSIDEGCPTYLRFILYGYEAASSTRLCQLVKQTTNAGIPLMNSSLKRREEEVCDSSVYVPNLIQRETFVIRHMCFNFCIEF